MLPWLDQTGEEKQIHFQGNRTPWWFCQNSVQGVPTHRSSGAVHTRGSACLQQREALCWGDCWAPRSPGGFSPHADRNSLNSGTHKGNEPLLCENRNEDWKQQFIQILENIYTPNLVTTWWYIKSWQLSCMQLLFYLLVTMIHASRASQVPKHRTRRHSTSTLCHVTLL